MFKYNEQKIAFVKRRCKTKRQAEASHIALQWRCKPTEMRKICVQMLTTTWPTCVSLAKVSQDKLIFFWGRLPESETKKDRAVIDQGGPWHIRLQSLFQLLEEGEPLHSTTKDTSAHCWSLVILKGMSVGLPGLLKF